MNYSSLKAVNNREINKSDMKIKELNYNDLAFFAGIEVREAKEYIADKLHIKERSEKTGVPKVKRTDMIKAFEYDFVIRSSTTLDGKNRMDYLMSYYGKENFDPNVIEKFRKTVAYRKAMRFTGKNTILNKIINPNILKYLQTSWLTKNVKRVQWSEKALIFIRENREFSYDVILKLGITDEQIEEQMKFIEEKESA